MIAGFGMLAWPAEYGETGVMTFQVSHQGDVLQADLGPETAETVAAIDAYDPDVTWTEVTDQTPARARRDIGRMPSEASAAMME